MMSFEEHDEFVELGRRLETAERERDNAVSAERNQRAIAQAAEADYRKARAQASVYSGVLIKIWALTRKREYLESRVLREMIGKTDVV